MTYDVSLWFRGGLEELFLLVSCSIEDVITSIRRNRRVSMFARLSLERVFKYLWIGDLDPGVLLVIGLSAVLAQFMNGTHDPRHRYWADPCMSHPRVVMYVCGPAGLLKISGHNLCKRKLLQVRKSSHGILFSGLQ